MDVGHQRLLVPKGTPIQEGQWTASLEPPELFEALRSRRLTGYARFTFPEGLALFLFHDGELGDAAFERQGRISVDLEAITATFEALAAGSGRLEVYSLSPDLVSSLRALLRGEALYQGQSLGLIDVKALLGRLKQEGLTGCLRVYTRERTALILFKDGAPLGFFHDGSPRLEVSAQGYQNVAGLPGAKLDVFRANGAASVFDLQDVVDLPRLWLAVSSRHATRQAERQRESQDVAERRREAQLAALERGFEEVVRESLGVKGGEVLARELARVGGRPALLERERSEVLLKGLEQAGKLLAGNSRTRQMVGSLRAVLDRLREAETAH